MQYTTNIPPVEIHLSRSLPHILALSSENFLTKNPKIKYTWICIGPYRRHSSKSLRYDTCYTRITQFYLPPNTRQRNNNCKIKCVCLSFVRYRFVQIGFRFYPETGLGILVQIKWTVSSREATSRWSHVSTKFSSTYPFIHVLQQFLPEHNSHSYSLRHRRGRRHNFILTTKK